MALGENIRRLRVSRGWSTHKLAEEAGNLLNRELFQSNISRYETNEVRPRTPVLHAIASVLGVPPIQLEYGDQQLLTASVGTHKVPLIEWVGVQEFLQSPLMGPEMGKFLPTAELYSPRVFGLKVVEDSMAPAFQPGDTIIVDPDVSPRPNDYVVAHHAGLNWLRQYKDRGLRDGKPAFELVPANDGYASIRSEDDVTILGTMVEQRTYRQK